MKDIKHYVLPEHTNNLYKEEAISSIGLTREIAEKINELIDAYNELSKQDLDWKQTQEGTIRKGVLFMKDNLLNSIQDLLDTVGIKLIDNTVLERMGGKVDKDGNEQITLAMLAQEVKEALTGGAVAVVGKDAVNTSNLVDKAVTEQKLSPSLANAVCYISPLNHNKPLIYIDRVQKTVTKRDYSGNLLLVTQGGKSWTLPFPETIVSTTYWNANSSFELFIDPESNILYITDVATRNDTLNACVYAGMVTSNIDPRTLIIPVEYNGAFIPAKHITPSFALAKVNKAVGRWEKKEFFADKEHYFNIDSQTKEVTKRDVQAKFIVNDTFIEVNFAAINIEVKNAEGDYTGVFFNTDSNTLIFDAPSSGNLDNHDNCYFFGTIATNPDSIHNSETVLCYSIDNKYYYAPGKKGRELSPLNIAFVRAYGSNIRATVDFAKRELIIPPHSALHAMYNNRYVTVGGASSEELHIPFGEASGYLYLVGGENGLKFVGSTEFNEAQSKYDIDQSFYFGFINENLKKVNFTFDCGIVKTLSIMGDSISTFEGFIPEGNAVYYNGSRAGVAQVNQTWWKRALNELGYSLNVNNSWSGSTVSTLEGVTIGEGTSAIERAELLDNGTDPDIILAYIGINDFNRKCPVEEFKEAYQNMLVKIEQRYKRSKVYVMTLPPCQRNLEDITSPEFNASGVFLREYNEVIREAARTYNAEVIDTEACGLTNFNGELYMGDYDTAEGGFLHPNADGHKLIADCVIKALK